MTAETMTDTDHHRCEAWATGNFRGECHRPGVVELGGQWFCKPHLAGRKRAAENERKRNEEFAARAIRGAVGAKRVAKLRARLGIQILYGWGWQNVTGDLAEHSVTMKLGDLEALAQRLEAEA